MSTWTASIDLTLTYLTLAIAFAYIVKRLWTPQMCQSKPKKAEVIVGNNLAKGLALIQKKQLLVKTKSKNKACTTSAQSKLYVLD